MTQPTPRPPRPRDELGRPLPWGSTSRLALEDYDSLSPEEDHRLGVAHFNAGRFFAAHEAWESVWKQRRGEPDEDFFKGLAQLGAGYVHYQRGNHHGAKTLLRRAVVRISRYGPRNQGLDVASLAGDAALAADAIERAESAGAALPSIAFPQI
jgi:predicted metal-dependent hydrolase